MFSMPQRLRKLIGTVILVIFLTIYCLAAMVYGATHMPDASVLAKTIFYVIGGFLWVVPAMGIVWWMQKPDKS